MWDTTSAARVGATACECQRSHRAHVDNFLSQKCAGTLSRWVSDSALMCKAPQGFAGGYTIVATIAGTTGSLFRSFSYDTSSAQTLQVYQQPVSFPAGQPLKDLRVLALDSLGSLATTISTIKARLVIAEEDITSTCSKAVSQVGGHPFLISLLIHAHWSGLFIQCPAGACRGVSLFRMLHRVSGRQGALSTDLGRRISNRYPVIRFF